MTELSILLPARNEQFLKNTVEDILKNKEAETEIIITLDGQWPTEGLDQHKDVTVIYVPEAIGQRAATNLACKLSKAKYVMKADAHCSFGKGFDRILLEDIKDDWTIVPKMYNLHVFDWLCKNGHRVYQGPTPEKCKECGEPMEKDILWKAKSSPETTAMRFDKDLKFQYWGGYKEKQKGDLVETMSILGACWMISRERYWELNICDENHGGWGQQGTEVSCASWLSGGKVIVDKRTWFAHMFRTQGGDFSFPYPMKGSDVNKARKYSKEIWLNNKHPKQIHNLDWLIDKFNPPDWEDYKEDKNPVSEIIEMTKEEGVETFEKHGVIECELPSSLKKGIVYYTDNKLELKIDDKVQEQLLKINIPIVSVSLKPMDFGKNIVLPYQRGILTMFRQILAGLEASEADIIFFAEHDILYSKEHFDFVPSKHDAYYYNLNIYKLRQDGLAIKVDNCKQTSGLCAYKELLVEHYRKRIAMVLRNQADAIENGEKYKNDGFNRRMGFEPGTHAYPRGVDNYVAESWVSKFPNIDIRHGDNLTPSRWSKKEFRNSRYTKGWTEAHIIPGWGETSDLIKDLF